MHVISRKRILQFCRLHSQAYAPLDHWYRTTKKAKWTNLVELRVDFPKADYIPVKSTDGGIVVFNIGGNKYRLKARVKFGRHKVLIRQIETHAEYDKNRWDV